MLDDKTSHRILIGCKQLFSDLTGIVVYGSTLKGSINSDIDLLILSNRGIPHRRHYYVDQKYDIITYSDFDLTRLLSYPEYYIDCWEFECGKIVTGEIILDKNQNILKAKKFLQYHDAWYRLPLAMIRFGQYLSYVSKLNRIRDEKAQKKIDKTIPIESLNQTIIFLENCIARLKILFSYIVNCDFPDRYILINDVYNVSTLDHNSFIAYSLSNLNSLNNIPGRVLPRTEAGEVFFTLGLHYLYIDKLIAEIK
jgi:predicted nucleotidyltransferase